MINDAWVALNQIVNHKGSQRAKDKIFFRFQGGTVVKQPAKLARTRMGRKKEATFALTRRSRIA